jgi:cell division initiation protein
MDLTPKLLTDIEFREAWRGYNREDVDEFLERVAVGVGELQQLVAELRERASTAERRLLERSDEDEIRRTLVLAQRTAEASISEARAEAERLVGEAQRRAADLDTEVDERRRTELGTLAKRRAVLEADIDALRDYVDRERQRLVAAMGEHVDFLTSSFALRDEPETSAVLDDLDELDDGDLDGDGDADAEKVHAEVAMAAPAVEEASDDGEADARDDADGGTGQRSASENLADALRRAGLDDLLADDAGEATGPHDALTDEEAEPAWREPGDTADDPFLAELRRAVSDTEPLGPRDHDETVVPDEGDAAESSGFLRRRRRA